jgi:hypothetical protein
MKNNDRKLLKQMISAGRFNYELYELLVQKNKAESVTMIKRMGNKWVCHPDNFIKRLEVPLPVLTQGSKVLRKGNK